MSTATEIESYDSRRCADLVARLGPRYAYEVPLAELQRQGSTVHVGGRSAFSVCGSGMYGELRAVKRLLFGQPGEPLPAPLSDQDWGLELVYLTPELLPPDLGMAEIEQMGTRMKISGPARALLEGLAVVPIYQQLQESYEILDLQRFLVPEEVQVLLEACASTLVKRIFLYLADCAKVSWMQALDLSSIDLGEGILEVDVEGREAEEGYPCEDRMEKKMFNEKYQLWLPSGIGEEIEH